jgi:hypothetical protein
MAEMPELRPTYPSNASLEALFAKTVRVRFAEPPWMAEIDPPGSALRLEVTGAELDSLREVMRLADGPGPHCMCLGDLTAEFEDAAGIAIAVTLHHGQTLRWKGPWEWEDAAFADPDAFMEWLAARGVPALVEEVAATADAGFAHLAADEAGLLRAVPLRRRLRQGVEIRRHDERGGFVRKVAALPGGLVKPFVADDGVYLPVGARVWRLGPRCPRR